MFTTYILRHSSGKLYKGVTNDIDRRPKEHLRGKTKTTKDKLSIELVYTEKYATFREAREREVYFKTAAGRRFLKNILDQNMSL